MSLCVCVHMCTHYILYISMADLSTQSETKHKTKVTVCLTQLVSCSDFLCSTLGWTEDRGAAGLTGLRIKLTKEMHVHKLL